MLAATRVCAIDANVPNTTIASGHLRLGGSDPAGNRLDVTSQYLTWNGKPYFVISGEFHYSRYPEADWEDELLKLRAGGINTVATYVFWNFHEACQGTFEWEGQKNVRRFVELAGRHGLKVILRIGPFAHGEWRNGGLPDWLYGQPYEVRSNAPGYLARVERLYAEIGRQVQGQLFADGGPIIGIQIENEYMHAGAPWEVVDPVRAVEWVPRGEEGVAHLKALKALAHKAGLDVPIYLVTAWGAPIIEDETLPVFGGYAYPVWVEQPAASGLYTFHGNGGGQSDAAGRPESDRYPLIFAEMQGGIQVRYHNRPIVPARAVEALALVCVGKGSNWLGYYMYHGGTTPAGQNERLHPQRSYDFEAPLGEFGETHASYHALRTLHLFLQSFGEGLGPMGAVLPAAEVEPANTDEVRYCVRTRDGAGYLFVNNFQDHALTRDLDGVSFEIETALGPVRIPESGSLTVAADACFILPFNQRLGEAQLISATAQPLTWLEYDGLRHFFYFVPDGLEAEYCFAADTIGRISGAARHEGEPGRLIVRPEAGLEHTLEIETTGGQLVRITTLTRAEAEHTWKGRAWGQERVFVSLADLIFLDERVEARCTGAAECTLTVWPPVSGRVKARGAVCEQINEGDRTTLRIRQTEQAVTLDVRPAGGRKFVVGLSEGFPAGIEDVFLRVDYVGDTGMAFFDGRLVADHFNNGTPWIIGLKRFKAELEQGELCLVFSPWRQGVVKNISSQLAGRFEFEGEERLEVQAITALAEYRTWLEVEGPESG